MALTFVEENAASRRRLESVGGRMTEADFGRATDYGWTIAALLAHMAFWDQRVLVLLRRWRDQGMDASPIDANAVNDALRPLCSAMDPHTAMELCLSSAMAVDAELETVTPEFFETIKQATEASGTVFRFSRAIHRNGHLDDIEALLKRA